MLESDILMGCCYQVLWYLCLNQSSVIAPSAHHQHKRITADGTSPADGTSTLVYCTKVVHAPSRHVYTTANIAIRLSTNGMNGQKQHCMSKREECLAGRCGQVVCRYSYPNQEYTCLLHLDARIKSTVQMSGMWWTDVLDVHVFEKVFCVTYTHTKAMML